MSVSWLTGSALASIVTVAGMLAAQDLDPARDPPAADILLYQIRPGLTIEQYVAQLVSSLRSADRNDDGLDRDDIAVADERSRAEARASRISRMLRYDLDGDLEVSRVEMRRAAIGESDDIDRLVEKEFEELDFDGDEVITLAEAGEAGDEVPWRREPLEKLLELDPDGDARLTAVELRHLVEAAFNRVDRDGDGKISASEHRSVASRIQAIQVALSAPVCDLPPLPPHAQLVAFGAYEGDSVASVAIGGPDQETNLIDVVIEPGEAQLYLVLTSYESMVWRLTGATRRVTNVVVSSSSSVRVRPGMRRPSTRRSAQRIPRPPALSLRGKVSASGVMGVPARKVTIARPGCLNYFSGNDPAGTGAIRATLQHSPGRQPKAIFGQYSVQRVRLPSGTITRAKSEDAVLPPGFDRLMWSDAVRFWPGGLVVIDPRLVVAEASVERYQVLPSQMGLAQLIGSGAIQRLPNGQFLIVRPITHMPPSMGGSHSVTLQLAPGIPMPPGDPVHSCIRMADGTSKGVACRE